MVQIFIVTISLFLYIIYKFIVLSSSIIPIDASSFLSYSCADLYRCAWSLLFRHISSNTSKYYVTVYLFNIL